MRPTRRSLARALGALALALAPVACLDDGVTAPQVIEETTFATGLGVDLAASTRTPSGLYYRDLTVGTGAPVSAGQRVSVRYSGWLSNGSLFDTTGPTGTPFTFTLGAGQVIPGWDEGVAGMRVGGSRQLVIPSSLAYGPSGNGPIPGGAVLVFRVDLVSTP